MTVDPNSKSFSGFRNPLLYTSILLIAALFYLGWVLSVRRREVRELKQRAKENERAEAARTFEMLGGDRFEILNFYAVPGVIRRGESAQLCYGVSNAKTVRLEPQAAEVWPTQSRCVEVAPKKDTTYTLTAEDGHGSTRTSSLTVQVR
ncbi:MAG TPA: hypothetical protein VEX69_05895 [Candidatus Limnocylindria bacterium]|nr:hypothetical protein [Candidatus Limnocylindria bacterium]